MESGDGSITEVGGSLPGTDAAAHQPWYRRVQRGVKMLIGRASGLGRAGWAEKVKGGTRKLGSWSEGHARTERG